MKSLRYLSPLLVLFSMTCVTNALGASVNVVITNGTSYTINELYASRSDNSTWDTSNNLIAGQTIAPGQATTITVGHGDDDNCTYDLMAVLYGQAQYAYQYQVNPCDGGSWTVSVGQ